MRCSLEVHPALGLAVIFDRSPGENIGVTILVFCLALRVWWEV